MRLNAGTSLEEIRSALNQDALSTWGLVRLEALRKALDKTAESIWTVLQEPLAPLSEEPDLSAPTYPSAREG